MEAVLNKQNRGLTIDIKVCEFLLMVLKRTEALSAQFKIRRRQAMRKLQKVINVNLKQTQSSTDSSTGIILEESARAKEMADEVSDDSTRARAIIDKDGKLSNAPGISSSMFCNNRNEGKVPLLKAI